MAGDWIKIQHATPDKPEVFQMAESLGIDPDAVVGKLLRCWIWADQQLRDCYAPSVTKTLLDRIAGVTGFTQRLIDVGWVQQTEEGLRFVNFDRHNGKTAKNRGLSQLRMQTKRSNPLRECYDPSVTNAQPEKRREEKSNKKSKKERTDVHSSFADWWSVYPRREGKAVAGQAYGKALATIAKADGCTIDEAAELLLEKTRRLLPSIEEREPQYRKTPAAWLNGGHWEDEPQQEFRQRIQTAEELDAWRPS